MEYLTQNSKISLIDDAGKELAYIIFTETAPKCYDIQHTVVDESLRGQGIAGQLVQMAVAEIHQRGGKVTASCSYAAKWMEKHGIRQ